MMKILTTSLLTLCFTTLIIAQQAPPPAFVNEIQIPPLVVNPDAYDLDVIQTVHDFNPGVPNDPLNGVTTFAFEDFNNPGTTTILGPTLVWGYQHMLSPSVLNKITDVTTCHWHGAHVPQFADGGPYQLIQPDGLWEPEFQVLDKSATMWYHPHAMNLTYKHVQMGLSGMIIVEDDDADPILESIHDILPTDYNLDDFPLIFQTKKFDADATGQMQIRSGFPGFKKDYEFMVNGIIDPFMNVPSSMIRVRLLNGDGKFSFNFTFEFEDGSTFPAHMIATDAGYMDRSYELENLLMAPGERSEWLLDLRGLQGETIYIKNKVSTMPDGIIGNSSTTEGYADDRQLLKLIIGPSASSSPIISFPIPLHPLETPELSEVSRARTKVFRKGVFQDDNGTDLFSIDSLLMDMTVINDTVMVDATEIWTLDNKTNVAHPWHIHDIHFYVTEVIDADGNMLVPTDHPEIFKGPKDNVLVQPGWKLSYITKFADYAAPLGANNSYMYHCHILPHEDKGMMGTFVVWDGETVSVDDELDLSSIPMKVHPNPAQEIVYLHGASAKTSVLRFIGMNGQILKEMSLPSFDGAIEINVDQLPEGMLFMDWQTHEGKAVSKVMISR